ncbi:LacI family DNA-binding transcriptional regulator [Iocasia frigidifontis]|uniref:LacI family DNA-binding transcriptional regulator n=1 Tax=Iocasia fonsfrigidae TaxID=2682810 RepID=A0A8A7KM24_9FIRM|nr:LacI family DNA-binding transcriptional regulator [Iocasia fonsfrigidae]QTL99134.1 LacI family DNA-binding transcriptional regulator [Iocasia fonsfrigidae]
MVTLKDVAEKAEVSIATVSSVINDSRPVAKETREKVLQVIEEMNYRPNSVAQALKSGKTKRILYIVPSITNLVFAQFINEVQHALTKQGYDLILLNNEARSDLTKSYLSIIRPSNIDGVIMTQTRTCGRIIADKCRDEGIPFVVLFEPNIFEDTSMVITDEEQGMAEAVKHLISYGHEKIGFVMVKDSRNQAKRYQGFLNALEENNIQFNENYLIECSDHDERDAYAHIKSYVEQQGLDFTALICCNDFLSHGAIKVFRELQIKIPEKISIIGYDDSIAQYIYPPLTSVSLPKKKLAETSVKMLLSNIRNGNVENKAIKYPQRLVVRSSTYINKDL